MGISRFEELEAWQRARELTAEVYRLSRGAQFAHDFGLRNQIQRASVSVMSNIAEGFERFNPAEFRQYLRISLGSAAEVRSQLYVALDLGYPTREEHQRVSQICRDVSQILARLRASVRSPGRASARTER